MPENKLEASATPEMEWRGDAKKQVFRDESVAELRVQSRPVPSMLIAHRSGIVIVLPTGGDGKSRSAGKKWVGRMCMCAWGSLFVLNYMPLLQELGFSLSFFCSAQDGSMNFARAQRSCGRGEWFHDERSPKKSIGEVNLRVSVNAAND